MLPRLRVKPYMLPNIIIKIRRNLIIRKSCVLNMDLPFKLSVMQLVYEQKRAKTKPEKNLFRCTILYICHTPQRERKLLWNFWQMTKKEKKKMHTAIGLFYA